MSNSTSAIKSLFLGAWLVLPTIAYNPEWANSTGYFDYLTDEDLGLTPGQFVKTTDNIGRKLIIKCLAPGLNQVAFERSTQSNIITSNEPHPRKIKTSISFSSSWAYNTLEAFLGGRDHTIVWANNYEVLFLDNDVTITDELRTKIENGVPFTYKEVVELGIDPYSAITSMSVKEYDV